MYAFPTCRRLYVYVITDLLSEASAGFCGFREMFQNECGGPWQGHGESVASALGPLILEKRRQMYLESASLGQERRGSCGVLGATGCMLLPYHLITISAPLAISGHSLLPYL